MDFHIDPRMKIEVICVDKEANKEIKHDILAFFSTLIDKYETLQCKQFLIKIIE